MVNLKTQKEKKKVLDENNDLGFPGVDTKD